MITQADIDAMVWPDSTDRIMVQSAYKVIATIRAIVHKESDIGTYALLAGRRFALETLPDGVYLLTIGDKSV